MNVCVFICQCLEERRQYAISGSRTHLQTGVDGLQNMRLEAASISLRNVSEDAVSRVLVLNELIYPCYSIHDLRQQAQYYATDRDEQVAKSTKVLAELIAPGRAIRARFFTLQSQVEDMQKGLAKLRKENTQSVCQAC